MIIGVSGWARNGKDTVGQILIEDHGFERRSFADPLRELLLDLDPIVTSGGVHVSLSYLVRVKGWDWVKDNAPLSRVLLQRLGAGVRRMDDEIWIRQAFKDLPADAVFTDVRYQNEAQEIVRRGGKVVRVVRPGFGPANDHQSERDLDGYLGFAYVLRNDGTVDDLGAEVARMLDGFR